MVNLPLPIGTPRPTTVRLVRGDCLDVIPTLAPQTIAMVFADFPYATEQRQVTANPWDIPFDLDTYWQRIMPSLTAGAVSAMTCKQPFSCSLIMAAPKLFRYDLVWDKLRPSRHLHAKRMPLLRHESVLIFYKPPCTYNPAMEKRIVPKKRGEMSVHSTNAKTPNFGSLDKNHIYTHRFPTTIVSAQRENYTTHPTQKPVALLEWLIRTYTNDGDTILDPVAGSGTTAIAAINVGNRHVICIEKDKTYFDIMTKRLAAHHQSTYAAVC